MALLLNIGVMCAASIVNICRLFLGALTIQSDRSQMPEKIDT